MKFFKNIFFIFFILASTACASSQATKKYDANYSRSFHMFLAYPSKQVYNDVTSKPEYAKGDSFLYDNGLLETVIDVKANEIIWRDNSHFRYSTSKNPLLGLRSWEWETPKSGLTVAKIFHDSNEDFMWPLRVGKKGKFYSTESIFNSKSGEVKNFKTLYSCKVEKTQIVTVPAGTYDSFVIDCIRANNFQRHMKYRLYYSPVLAHIVKKTYIYDGDKRKDINLVEAGPRPSALSDVGQDILARAVQYALEYKTKNQTLRKHIKDLGIDIFITPKETYKTDLGAFCRKYEQRLEARGRTSIQNSVACRDEKDETWKTPREFLK